MVASGASCWTFLNRSCLNRSWFAFLDDHRNGFRFTGNHSLKVTGNCPYSGAALGRDKVQRRGIDAVAQGGGAPLFKNIISPPLAEIKRRVPYCNGFRFAGNHSLKVMVSVVPPTISRRSGRL